MKCKKGLVIRAVEKMVKALENENDDYKKYFKFAIKADYKYNERSGFYGFHTPKIIMEQAGVLEEKGKNNIAEQLLKWAEKAESIWNDPHELDKIIKD